MSYPKDIGTSSEMKSLSIRVRKEHCRDTGLPKHVLVIHNKAENKQAAGMKVQSKLQHITQGKVLIVD